MVLLTTIASSTASNCETSCRLAPVTTSDNGTPQPSTNKWRLLPFFSPIRWIWAHAGLRQWRFHHRPVNALPSPGDAFNIVVLGKPSFPKGFKEACFLPFKRAWIALALP